MKLAPVAPRETRAASHVLPAGACDTHAHVFGPYERFPLPVEPSYAPPLAAFAKHKAMLDAAGLFRGVLVQPSPYAQDMSALIDALAQGRGALRGIGSATAAISDDELQALDHAGVRGLRFTDMLDPNGNPYHGSVNRGELPGLMRRMSALGWHALVWAKCADGVALADKYAGDVPVVFDHMAVLSIAEGLQASAFQRLLALLKEGRVWVKLTVCRVSKQAPAYADLRPFHDALVEANPARLLWGSDWPFVRMGDAAPDVGALIDLFYRWVDDAQIRQQILVDNPQALYRF